MQCNVFVISYAHALSVFLLPYVFPDKTFSPDKTMYCIERGSYLDSCNSFKQTLAPVVLIYCGIKNRRVAIASNTCEHTPPMEKKN